MEKPKNRPGQARLEYRSIRPDVEARLKQGLSLKLIHGELLEAGRLTMCYRTFCQYVRGGGRIRGKRKESFMLEPSCRLLDLRGLKELDSDGPGTNFGYDLPSVHRTLAGIGVAGLNYSDFSDYFQESQI